MPAPRREFLGWDGAALPRVAEWLVGHAAELGGDLSRVLVALPGRRAARRLEQHLARRLPADVHPPRLVPVGHVPDELLLPDRPFAARLLRTLLWRDALRDLPAASRAALLRHPPAAEDTGAWLALAEDVRTLHAELVAQGRRFEDVAPAARRLAGEAEARRWQALAEARAAFLLALERHGLADPHEGRRAALERGALDADARVVLVGIADPNALVRDLVARLGERATLLILAPASMRDAFDESGGLRTEAWTTRPVELAADAWRLVDRPDDQAAATLEWLDARAGRLRPDEIVIGVPDAEVVPHLQRRFGERGAVARPAEGRPLARSSPLRLLTGLLAHLAAPSFATFAALLRHPELLAVLRAAAAGLPDDLLERLDRYHADHLPDQLPETWPGLDDEDTERAEDAAAVAAAQRALDALLADLRGDRPAAGWAGPLASLLAAAWGAHQLDEARPDDRALAAALRRVAAGLDELAALPPGVGAPLAAAEALRLLLRSLEREAIPEPADPDAIELLGWLELPLDDAPAVVVTGFNEGHVPSSVRGHPLLPDVLRREVGLPDDARRLARDAYALELLARARTDLLVVTGRRNQDGDPLRPSRLLFLAPDDVAVERARQFGQSDESTLPAVALSAPAPRRLPRLDADVPVRRVSVTDFRTFIESPYRYYLERVLGLERAVDDARELEPHAFGSLAHAVLAGLVEDEAARLHDAKRLAAWLHARLQRTLRAQFGRQPPPAVALQAEHLAWRLEGFATWRADQQRQGWRIARAEWRGETRLRLDEGELRLTGRIDAVDVGPRGQWRVIDYKTGDSADGPRKTHGPNKQGAWKDLQLPLYLDLVEPLRTELRGDVELQPPELGYVVLPRARPEGDDWWKRADWDGDQLTAARELARQIGSAILRGDFAEQKRWSSRDEVFAAILGEGLMADTTDDAPESETAEDDA